MNLKLAKQLRRTAKAIGLANKLPERSMIEGKKNKMVVGYKDELKEADGTTYLNGEVKLDPIYFEYTGTDKNHPKSIRGIYRSMKSYHKQTCSAPVVQKGNK